MLPRVLRCALFAIVTVAIWTLSRPAFAMSAPLCDDRGATMLAPPPTLEPPEEALLRAPPAPASLCESQGLAATPAASPGHGDHQAPSSQVEAALPVCSTPIASPSGDLIGLPPVDAPSTEGVQYRIERPPR